MSKQLNLLAYEVRPPILTGLRTLLGAALLIPPLLLYGAYTWFSTSQLAASVARNEVEINAEKAKQTALQAQIAGRPVPVNLGAEIELLKPLEMQSQKVLNLLQQGDPKARNAGYVAPLSLLARTTEEGLWLTSIKVGNGGKSLSLEGNALRNESVVRYVQRLNEVFAPAGAKFTSLELQPEPTKEGDNKDLPIVSFKLN